MSVSTAKLSLEASDVQSEEDCDELADNGFCFSSDISEKIREQARWGRSSGKAPPPPGSPYRSGLNRKPRRVAVAAWRLPRSSLGASGGATPGESSLARLTSPSNGHEASQTPGSRYHATAQLFRQTLSLRKDTGHSSSSSGFAPSTADYREKEDMYDEIIRLKKSLQAHKSDNQQLKVKLRRLEEDTAKREKQIEELLDPAKGSAYTRSFVDKKKEGSVVVNGLKQRILKLEQQCREKENALSNLQSELRTTNLEELKLTAETYFQEIQRLRILLEAAEKNRAESRCSQRQQKALSSAVHRLSGALKELQQENSALREELSADAPAGGPKGYRDWSKQRLLRRLLEVETRLEDGRGHAPSAKRRGHVEQEVQTVPAEVRGVATATEAGVSVGTMTEDAGGSPGPKELLGQLEEERAELQETLWRKDEELRQLRSEKEDLEKETECWKAEQMKERDQDQQQHKEELEQLMAQIQTLEARLRPAASAVISVIGQAEASPEERGQTDEGGGGERSRRGRASAVIQRSWREHREREAVMLQSALRGHLSREPRLRALQEELPDKAVEATHPDAAAGGPLDGAALTLLQSAFRGHLARCTPDTHSSSSSVPPPMGTASPVLRAAGSARPADRTDQVERRCAADSSGAAAVDSDDSDDIVVSPSRPLRTRS